MNELDSAYTIYIRRIRADIIATGRVFRLTSSQTLYAPAKAATKCRLPSRRARCVTVTHSLCILSHDTGGHWSDCKTERIEALLQWLGQPSNQCGMYAHLPSPLTLPLSYYL